MDGFLIIDKPAGWTSHNVVAHVRRMASKVRTGHTGTLDPDATGVLIVCLGLATRLIEYTEGYTKSYSARLVLGMETDSQDAGGAVTSETDASGISETALQAVLPSLTGDIEQIPPMVSAVHHDGRRLYELAREGKVVERKPRSVTVYRLEASDFTPGPRASAELRVECSAGTYIRTLCADIGTQLGVGGHMTTLCRTAVGPHTVDKAVSLETLERDGLEPWMQPSAALLPPEWPLLPCGDTEVKALLVGKLITGHAKGNMAAAVSGNRILAILRREGDLWQPVKVFPESIRCVL